MIKNFNDILSLATLIVLVFFCVKFFFGFLFSSNNEVDNVSKRELLKEYSQNEEE